MVSMVTKKSLKEDLFNKLDHEKFANSKSYLKPRRHAATKQKRGKILNFLDSSIGDLADDSFPNLSHLPGPAVPLSPRKPFRSKSLTSASGSSRKEILADDLESPMEEVLRSLGVASAIDRASLAQEDDNDVSSTSCTDIMSSSSFNFNLSARYHENSLASLYSTSDENSNATCEKEKIQEKKDKGEEKKDQDSQDWDWEDYNMEEYSSCYESELSEVETEDETDSYFLEEEYSIESDEESFEEEELIADDDEYSYTEEIIVQDHLMTQDSKIMYEEIYVSEGEEESIGDYLEIFEETLEEEDGVERILGGSSRRYENSLGIINEAEEESENSDRTVRSSKAELYDYVVEDEILEEWANEDYFEVEITDDESEDDYEVVEDNEDYQIIEEEIVMKFEVPVIPAIAVWQEKEESRAYQTQEEPPAEAKRTPREILIAVLTASAMDFKLRKVPKEHKQRFVSIAETVASLGRLNKLDEVIVEGTGQASAINKEEKAWQPTAAPIVFHRSRSLRISTEAAAMGRVMRLPEIIVANYEEQSAAGKFFEDESKKVSIDDMVDENGHKIFRTSVLVPLHEQDTRQASMSRDWNLDLLENVDENDTITLENVQLPTTRIPRFHKPSSNSKTLTRREIHDAIARGVAEGAWDRRYRLDRPQKQLRITSICRCRYCQNPNPFQTHAYKLLASSSE